MSFLHGLKWTSAATLVNMVAQVGFIAVLARLLEPADFGLMAMTAIVLRFASFFAQLGVVEAVIQKDTLTRHDLVSAWWIAFVVSSLFFVLMFFLAPLFASYFRSVLLVDLVRVVSVTIIINSQGGLMLGLLRREGRFKEAATIEVAAYLFGYGAVGVVAALLGWGVWSLAAATVAQSAISLLLGWIRTRYPLAGFSQATSMMHFVGLGTKYSLIGFLEFIAANVEVLFIGRYIGKAELGYYNRAQVLANMPVEQPVAALAKVMFPKFSAMQQDLNRMGSAFILILLMVGLVSCALAAALSAAAGDVVRLILGEKWLEVIPLVSVLSLAVPPMYCYVVCGITLDSLAALDQKLKLQAFIVVLKIALVFALLPYGIVGIAWAAVLGETIRLALGLFLCRRAVQYEMAGFRKVIVMLGLVFCAVFLPVWAVATFLPDAGVPLPLRLIAEGSAFLVAAWLLLGRVLRLLRELPAASQFDSIRKFSAYASRLRFTKS